MKIGDTFLGEMEKVSEASVESSAANVSAAGTFLQPTENRHFQPVDSNKSSNTEPTNQFICNRLEIETPNCPLNFDKVNKSDYEVNYIKWLQNISP